MPIFIGTSVKNQQQISLGNTQMGKVYVGDKLVWEKPSGIVQVKYGLLYNWYAATDARNIANTGWSVPSVTQMQDLRLYLDNSGTPSTNVAGGKLKEVGTAYWYTPNTGATNEVGFNGRGGGDRNYSTGTFNGLLGRLSIWTNTISITTLAHVGYIDNTGIYFRVEVGGSYRAQLSYGLSVRLIKTTTSLSHGQTGTYVGNDGKVYRTICIGTQEWLADNLVETKYRNGDPITEVTDNAAWAALTTGALCAYGNDWSNV